MFGGGEGEYLVEGGITSPSPPLSYALVQQLHSLISSSLSPALEQRLASCPVEGDGQDMVAQITEEVLESLE